MSETDWGLPYSFWHRSPDELTAWRPLRGRAQLVARQVGPYVVRTWLNHDGKPIATGWFTV